MGNLLCAESGVVSTVDKFNDVMENACFFAKYYYYMHDIYIYFEILYLYTQFLLQLISLSIFLSLY